MTQPMEPAPASFSTQPDGEASYTMTVRGELDVATSPALRTELHTLVEQGAKSIRIDLCSQDSTTAITPLFNTSNFLIVEVDNGPRRAVTVSNYRAAIAAETYRFGFCVASNSTPVTLDRNDWVNGWVTITN